jgi:chromosomal replication initiation ATPase DnaA
LTAPVNAPSQLNFDLSAERPDYSRATFLRTASTRDALAAADAFLHSPEPALAIVGPAGSGKTHLAHVIAETGDGAIYDASRLPAGDCVLLVIDNAERCPDPQALLAVLEGCIAQKAKFAIAGSGLPGEWAKGLRDLRTRLEAMPRVTLKEPDEELLRAIIDRLFRRRQWRVSPAVAAYAAPRLPRTFAAAAKFVNAACAAALAGSRPLGLALAKEVLDSLSEG